jgi:hypothetical protein
MSDGVNRAVAAGFPKLDPTTPGLQSINPFSLDPQDGIQTRVGPNEKRVEQYIDAMARGDEFPPASVIVVDGEAKLVDGFHRHEAACRSIGKSKVGFRVEVRLGTAHDALVEALTANAKHGLSLTGKDHENRYLMACRDPVLRTLSVRKMARFLGLHKSKVERLRSKHKWTKEKTVASDDGNETVKVERLSSLPPLSVTHGPPKSPAPLGPLAISLVDAAVEAASFAESRGKAASGPFVAEALKKAVRSHPVSGAELDSAIREVMTLALWLYKARQADDLTTGPEVAERVRQEVEGDY